MKIRTGHFAVRMLLGSTTTLACVLGLWVSSMPMDVRVLAEPPTEYIMVIGIVYEADGVTPAVDCIVKVTNKNTGDWALTTTADDGFYTFSTAAFETYVYGGEVINVTVTRGPQIGWDEGVATWPYVQIDVTLSEEIPEFPNMLVPILGVVCAVVLSGRKRKGV